MAASYPANAVVEQKETLGADFSPENALKLAESGKSMDGVAEERAGTRCPPP